MFSEHFLIGKLEILLIVIQNGVIKEIQWNNIKLLKKKTDPFLRTDMGRFRAV